MLAAPLHMHVRVSARIREMACPRTNTVSAVTATCTTAPIRHKASLATINAISDRMNGALPAPLRGIDNTPSCSAINSCLSATYSQCRISHSMPGTRNFTSLFPGDASPAHHSVLFVRLASRNATRLNINGGRPFRERAAAPSSSCRPQEQGPPACTSSTHSLSTLRRKSNVKADVEACQPEKTME